MIRAADVRVRDETIELNGLRVHYRDWGNLRVVRGFLSGDST